MKKKEFEKLLGFVDLKDISTSDFSGFKDPEAAKTRLKELIFFRKRKSAFEKDFSPIFTDHIMRRVNQITQYPGIQEYLSMQFSKVMTFGLTAVFLVFIALYLFQGQEGIGTIFGTDRSNDINFISYLFYEF